MEPPRVRVALVLFLILLLLNIAVALSSIKLPEKRESTSVLKVSFLDVGQGDAILIQTPNRKQILIDGGPSPHITRVLGEIMPWGDRSIDMVLATHADADHIGGLPQVLESYKVDTTVEPRTDSETAVYAAWQILEREEGSAQLVAERGQLFDLGGGVYLTILYPSKDLFKLEGNDASIVARLSYGDTCFVLTGDANSSVELVLSKIDKELLDCEVLKVGHHGSRTSTSEQFVQTVSPQYAVISAGENNRYGHPHREVVETLDKAGVEILGTYIEGTITFESDGDKILRR